jgi:hypothetical protein
MCVKHTSCETLVVIQPSFRTPVSKIDPIPYRIRGLNVFFICGLFDFDRCPVSGLITLLKDSEAEVRVATARAIAGLHAFG